MELNKYSKLQWNRIAILGETLAWPDVVDYEILHEFGDDVLGGGNALMFVRKTKELKRGGSIFTLPKKSCPQDAIDRARRSEGNYGYASLKSLHQIKAVSELSPEALKRIIEDAARADGKYVFYIIYGTSLGSPHDYVKAGWAKSLQRAHARRKFRIDRDRYKYQGATVDGLCAVPVESESVCRRLEQSFEAAFGPLCRRRLEDPTKRWGAEFYQPNERILDLATQLGSKYPYKV